MLDAGELGLQLVDQLEVAVANKQGFDSGCGNHVFQLGRFGAVVQGHESGAQCSRSVVGFNELVGVRLEHGHPVARLDTQVAQHAGQPSHALQLLAVGQPRVFKDENFLIGKHRARNA